MKKILTNSMVIIAALMTVFFSCKESFLEKPATGAVSEGLLTSTKGLEGALIAVYGQINGKGAGGRMASPSNWVWGSIRGGDANKGTDPGDFSDINPIQRYEYLSTQGVISEKWQGNYEGISRANAVLRLIAKADAEVADSTKTRISAEARFLRGHYYFELKKAFGNVPYVDESVDYDLGIEKVKNDADVWPKIEADFKFAFDNLPATQSAVGRANKWAAATYLAKAYLFQKKFPEAKTLFDQVIASGQTTNGKKYALAAKYADVFRASNDNNPESVFAVQAAANTGSVNNANPEFDLNWPYNTGANGPGNCCGFFQPSFEMVNSHRTDANGLPLLDGSYNSDKNAVVSDMGLLSKDKFTPDAGNLDPRLDHSVGRRGIPFLDWIDHPGADWIRNQANGGPYSPKKYAYYKTDVGSLQDNSSWTPGYTAINYTVIRFADVLLMAAEAEVEAGTLEKAREYVNMVRARSANPDGFVKRGSAPAAKYVISTYKTAWTDKEAARAAVRFERKLELNLEGHRFFDLVRWGVAEKELNAYLTFESKELTGALGNTKFAAKYELLPIPQSQIDLQGADVLKQNPGF